MTPATHRRVIPMPAHAVGMVVGHAERVFTVDSADGLLQASRAASCLLEPVIGDVVACLRLAPDEVWIIAVLEREEGVENTLRCDGPTRIVTGPAALTIESGAMHVQTEDFVLKAARAEIAADSAEVVGSELRVIGARMKLIGTLLSTVFERVTHFSKHYLRTTEGIDRVQATHIEQEAAQLLRLSGEHALINGEKLVKTRGGQIHFG
ncbi:MAG TPA: DUF3540 domain-containing protein [Vicinamibacterales bacterium]|nr:DUF3540 domain-containing protein [Vicinamibacterales bacterium]